MTALPPDYDSDHGRWGSWKAPQDVHDLVAPGLRRPVLDIGCGEGRLAARLSKDVRWVGVDSSPAQAAANPYRPVLLLRPGGCYFASTARRSCPRQQAGLLSG